MEKQFSDGVLRAKDAAAFLGIGMSTLWYWAQLGKIPAGIRLSNRCTVWRRRDLETFLNEYAK